MKHFKTDYNPVTGAREDYYWDEMDQKLTIRNRHDVTDVIEGNKQQQNASLDSRYGNQMMHHVADIPMAVVMQWKKEGLDIFRNDPETKRRLRRKLNDPDYRYLKTTVKKL